MTRARISFAALFACQVRQADDILNDSLAIPIKNHQRPQADVEEVRLRPELSTLTKPECCEKGKNHRNDLWMLDVDVDSRMATTS